ncbi:MAG TPA: hypothetical protein VGM75_30685 [Pseudonocardiaceae bacterium]|jgi:hypothetical protein
MPTFASREPIAIALKTDGAQVQVAVGEHADTVVEIEPGNASNRKHVAVAEGTKVRFSGGKLTIRTTEPGDENGGSIAVGNAAKPAVAAEQARRRYGVRRLDLV